MKKNLWKLLLVSSFCAVGFGFSNCEKVNAMKRKNITNDAFDAKRLVKHVSTINITLIEAAEKGNLEIVKFLVKEEKADVNVQNNHGRTALMKAAYYGHLNIVEFLVKEGKANVNDKDNKGRTALMKAANKGHFKIVEFLVKEGKADVNAIDKQGRTALMIAAWNDYCEMVKFLVENGANINSRDNNGCTASNYAELNRRFAAYLLSGYKQEFNKQLISAVEEGKLNDVKNSLNRGADVNTRVNDGKTALMIALDNEKKVNWEIVEFLVKEGKANVNASDNKGRTALMKAAKNGHLKIVEFLINNEADVNVSDDEGCTALMYASQIPLEFLMYASQRPLEFNDQGEIRLQIVKELLQKGAKIKDEHGQDIKDNYGCTALMYATRSGDFKIVEFLVRNGADVNAINKQGRTALMEAVHYNNWEIAKCLIDNGADVNVRAGFVDIALINAAHSGNFKMVEFFINNGANINALDHMGCTALMWAAWNGHLEIVEFLVRNGADVNAIDKQGRTALMIALGNEQNVNWKIVEFLVRNGAKVDAKDKKDRTALMTAAKNGQLKIVEYLVNDCNANVYFKVFDFKYKCYFTALDWARVKSRFVSCGADKEKYRKIIELLESKMKSQTNSINFDKNK